MRMFCCKDAKFLDKSGKSKPKSGNFFRLQPYVMAICTVPDSVSFFYLYPVLA